MGIEQQWANATSVVVALVTTYGFRVVGAVVLLVGGWWTARFLYFAIVRLCERSARLDRTITYFLANAARYSILVFTFTAVLSTFGIATTSFVAVLGALGIAIGLALQGTLSNLAAGIMLVLFRPFRIGDRIETHGVIGRTREINLFYSELDTDDNVRVIVPNGKLWGEIVKIPSRNDVERVELKFTRPLSDDVGSVIACVREVVEGDKRVRQMDQIGVDVVNDVNYVLVTRMWVPRRDAMQVHFDINHAVNDALQQRPPDPGEARAAD